MGRIITTIIVGITLSMMKVGFAEESKSSEVEANQKTNSHKPTHRSKGRVKREREAEGTQAQNQFDSDVITKKSEYKLDGRQLEVDPD